MQFEFDLSTVPVVKPIPDGIYIFRVDACKDLKAASTGNPQVQFELSILQPTPVMVGDAKVEKHYHYLTLTPKTQGMFRDFFDACGKLRPGVGLNTDELIGSTFGGETVKTVNEQGREQSNIVKVMKITDPMCIPGFKEAKDAAGNTNVKVGTGVVDLGLGAAAQVQS